MCLSDHRQPNRAAHRGVMDPPSTQSAVYLPSSASSMAFSSTRRQTTPPQPSPASQPTPAITRPGFCVLPGGFSSSRFSCCPIAGFWVAFGCCESVVRFASCVGTQVISPFSSRPHHRFLRANASQHRSAHQPAADRVPPYQRHCHIPGDLTGPVSLVDVLVLPASLPAIRA